MKKNKYLISKEKIEFIQSLEEFFIDYEPKFGEKIKVRRFLAGLKKIKIELQDQILNSRLKKIKNTNLKKKDIEALKSVDEDIINDHLQKLKRDNNLPLIVKLMERVNKSPKSTGS